MYRLDRFREEHLFLDSFLTDVQVENSMFVHWIEAHIRYKCLFDILRFYAAEIFDPKVDLPSKDYELWVRMNTEALPNATFSRFYALYLNAIEMNLSGQFQRSEMARDLIEKEEPLWEENVHFMLLQLKESCHKDYLLSLVMFRCLAFNQVEIVSENLHHLENQQLYQELKEMMEKQAR